MADKKPADQHIHERLRSQNSSPSSATECLELMFEWIRRAPLCEILDDEEDLLAFATKLPKVDLHRHLEGSIEPEELLRIGTAHHLNLPAADVESLRPHVQMTVGQRSASLLEFFEKFEPTRVVFKSLDIIADLTEGVVRNAARDNVEYLELRFSPVYMAKAHLLSLREVMDGVILGVERVTTTTRNAPGIQAERDPICVKLIVIVERPESIKTAHEVRLLAEEYSSRGVVAMDLANDELNYPPAPFREVFQKAKQCGLGITIHAGEVSGPGADNVRTAVEDLGADRLGHAVTMGEVSSVMDLVIQRKVPVEVCVTSNLHTGVVSDPASHPLRSFYDAGVFVTLNTDDPAVSGITMSQEIALALSVCRFSLNDVWRLTENAVKAAFLREDEVRINLLKRISLRFREVEAGLLGSLHVEELLRLAKLAVECAATSSALSAAEKKMSLELIEGSFQLLVD